MVASIAMPQEWSLGVLAKVMNERKKFLSFYERVYMDMQYQYICYKEYQGNPEKIFPLDISRYTDTRDEAIARKNSLINMYSPKNNNWLYTILEKMRYRHELLFCPSCGEDGAPGTLDHYLPKTEFPELSICLLNLTPMCSKCQGKKSTDYLTSYNRKAFLHPYYDQIEECLFHIGISPPYKNPSFTITIKDNIHPQFRCLIESHIEGIGFIERIEIYCETKHMQLLKLMAEEREEEHPLSAAQLTRACFRLENKKAANAWGAIYFRSVLETPALLNYLEHGELPDYL